VDLIERGILDSMGWVSFLRGVESASGAGELGSALNDRSASFAAVFDALQRSESRMPEVSSDGSERDISKSVVPAVIAGSSSVVGSHLIPSEEVDRAFGMSIGKLRSRAGIESVAHAAEGENELVLGAEAAQDALRAASCGAQQLDWIVATSETHHDYPSLSAQIHSRLLVRENCGALDVGGACLGLLNAFVVAQSLISSGQAQTVAVVTADVHSRTLTPGRVAGEFGGLFGDGASAFILRREESSAPNGGYRLGEFLFGCAGQYAAAIQVSDEKDGGLAVRFDGEALSRAAITRMEKVLAAVELRSGISRTAVGGFATHQPNPRLVTLLAKQCGVSPSAFPPIAKTSGNLGSSTCGAALHAALQVAAKQARGKRQPIFLASLGPGLLFGGGWLTPQD
jgi:3-oxoacyl-[acyl-carrier-protein] synthase-3